MKPYTSIAMILVAALAAGALNGCGGGGGSAVAPTPPTSFDLQMGISGLVTNGQTVAGTLSGTATASGTSVPFTGSGTYTLAPRVSTSFNGEGALSRTESISGTVSAAIRRMTSWRPMSPTTT